MIVEYTLWFAIVFTLICKFGQWPVGMVLGAIFLVSLILHLLAHSAGFSSDNNDFSA